MSKLIDFVGSKLTHGSFHQMCLEMSKQIAITTPAALKLEALAPEYADAVARMGNVILRQSGYAETLDVSRTDANRDALFYSIYYAVHYLRSLSADHALHPRVKQLMPLINTYKGISQHELNKESSEIASFLANAALPDNAKAVQALGLTPCSPPWPTRTRSCNSPPPPAPEPPPRAMTAPTRCAANWWTCTTASWHASTPWPNWTARPKWKRSSPTPTKWPNTTGW